MDLTNEAAVGGSEQTSIVIAPAPAGETSLGAREAARNLASWRHDREKLTWHPLATAERRGSETPSAPEQVATDGTDVGEHEAPADEAAGAEQDNDPLPIEPPLSCSEEEKAVFASLPRDAQERLAERERTREGELAEQRKALDADRALLDEARQKYEATLPQLLAALHQRQAGEFVDIKTPADIERLAREDEPRLLANPVTAHSGGHPACDRFAAQWPLLDPTSP